MRNQFHTPALSLIWAMCHLDNQMEVEVAFGGLQTTLSIRKLGVKGNNMSQGSL